MTTITTTYTSPGSGTWLCPAGVFQVKAQCWGAGGGGAKGGGSNYGGGGGGSGEYAGEAVIDVSPGTYYRWTVGKGGGASKNGGQSVFYGEALTVVANGGGGAPAVSGTSAPGGAAGSGSTNTLEYPGAAGGTGSHTGAVGAGGGGASSGGTGSGGNAGGNAVGTTGGAGGAAVTGGGGGGSGGPPSSTAGSGPGGGGGGGEFVGYGYAGAAGGDGQVTLSWTAAIQPQVPIFPAGYAPLPSDFNGWIQAPMQFLTSKVVFSAELTTGTTLTNGTGVVLPFNSSIYDPLGGWNGTSHEWLCPAGYSGTYEVTVTVSSASNSDTTSAVQALVAVNTPTLEYAVGKSAVPSGSSALASGSMLVQLYGGVDYVQGLGFFAASSGNSSVITTAGQRCQIAITWVSL